MSRPSSKSVQSLHNLFNILQAHLTASDKTANVICSPFNVATCLSMLADGAVGTSREELISFFSFAGPDQKISLQNELLKTFSAILPAAQKTSSIAQMVKSAQGIFVTKEIQQSYIQKVQTDYRAIAKQINPAADIPGAVKDVNDFVSNSTEGNITELVQASDFSANTIMVLVAALFFKGKFATPFDKEKTANKEFHVAPGKIKEVPTMFGAQKNAKLIEAGGVTTLAIPYAGSEVYLVLEMKKPAKGEIYAPLPEKSDVGYIIGGCSERAMSQEVIVYLPKFKARSTIKDVKDVFINKCGVKEIFDPKKNDFHPIVGGNPSDSSAVYISSIIHQATVEVDEVGTVAAAATAAVMTLRCAAPVPKPTVTFDHPFYYHIVDQKNGTILFSGSITDPSAKSS